MLQKVVGRRWRYFTNEEMLNTTKIYYGTMKVIFFHSHTDK